MSEQVRLTIDGIEVTVPRGTNLIEAARRVGILIPHYCYHPHLSAPANCRMCLVEIEGFPKLTPSCATQAADGMVVRTNTPGVMASHRSVLEFYLTNHPLDCPVCDQAGECVLQDYTYAFGPEVSRFTEEKFAPANKDLGGDILLFTDRCIMCTRCVRFLREVSGTGELAVVNRSAYAEIHAAGGHPVTNPLAGNTVDICPVGALCSRDFLYKCRVWWLHSTASACPRCARACSIRIDTNNDRIHRIKPMDNPDINSTWICDEGRFAFKLWQGTGRLDHPLVREGESWQQATWSDALGRTVRELRRAISAHGPSSVAFIGSPFCTSEENGLLARLFASFGATTCSLWPPPNESRQEFPGFVISGEKAWNFAGAQRAVRDVCGAPLPIDRLADLIDEGRVRAVYALGGAYRDAPIEYDDLGLESLEFFALQTCFMSDKGIRADVVLPGASPYEKTGSVRNEDGIAQQVNAALDPPGQARPDWDILCELAHAMASKACREGIEAVRRRPAAHWEYTRGISENE